MTKPKDMQARLGFIALLWCLWQWFLYALVAFVIFCPLVIPVLILIWLGEVLS
jgi:hypothetical protein